MPVPILKQGANLIATVQAALTDVDAQRLQDDLMDRVSRFRSHGIVIDVTAIDVMDSFAARSLRTLAQMTRLRGADTVIVGLQPEVAFAMVQLGLVFDELPTALDLEEGLALLDDRRRTRRLRPQFPSGSASAQSSRPAPTPPTGATPDPSPLAVPGNDD